MDVLRLTALVIAVAGLATGAVGALSPGDATTRFSTRAASDATLSTNWAGYAVTAPAAAGVPATTFTDVTGTWVQPRVKCAQREVGAAAFWVGLGGWDQASQALEQIGTEADCDRRRQVTYSAWYEIVPAGPVTLPLRIHAGDRVNGAVVVSGSQVVFSLKNLTRHTRFGKRVTPATPLDVGSAEWIAEAPSLCRSSGNCTVVPLTNFGKMSFARAAAIGNGHPGTISDTTWSPTQVVLAPDPGAQSTFGVLANTHGAVPSATSADGRSFSVSWRRKVSAANG